MVAALPLDVLSNLPNSSYQANEADMSYMTLLKTISLAKFFFVSIWLVSKPESFKKGYLKMYVIAKYMMLRWKTEAVDINTPFNLFFTLLMLCFWF